jgi:transposase-like protein
MPKPRSGTNCTPRQRRHHHRNKEREQAFCRALESGKSIAAAAALAGIARRTAYNWREADEAFAAQWDDAWEVGTDRLEDLALKGAEDGSEKLLLALLKARRPKRYGISVVEHGGNLEILLKTASEALDAKLARLIER